MDMEAAPKAAQADQAERKEDDVVGTPDESSGDTEDSAGEDASSGSDSDASGGSGLAAPTLVASTAGGAPGKLKPERKPRGTSARFLAKVHSPARCSPRDVHSSHG